MQYEPDCQSEHETGTLSVQQALQNIKNRIHPVSGFEQVATREALNKVLAKDVLSTINVPAFTNAAMDGYAIRYEDIQANKNTNLNIVGSAYAGNPSKTRVSSGDCIRIMTGAALPEGTDTVVMQEHVHKENNHICIKTTYDKYQNVRFMGEDLKQGEVALSAGQKLKAADIGLIASLGISEVCVTRNIRVAFFSTGDELRGLGETLEAGQIYDSNRYTIYSMLKNFGADIIDMGIIRDEPVALRNAFQTAAANADVLITTGGVSVGDADYVKEILTELGDIHFWKIAMKPGRPLAVGAINKTFFFGLPGNPVSAMVTFYQFVQPALRQLRGQKATDNVTIRLKCASSLSKRPGRVDFQRGIIFMTENGDYQVKSTGDQGSHMLSSMCRANCFIVLSKACDGIVAGDFVEVQPFEGLY
ncbi:MAG TPA: molybdopterin molybdenumtransferase MoeA [Gammaproteobacteria bacterium]|nr:molybdopterin molybdenumtransferase MoeA [Gammaproteobacteria bacterium]